MCQNSNSESYYSNLSIDNNNNNSNTFVERHSAVASEALAEQVS